MCRNALLTAALTVVSVTASAAPITGGFSLVSLSGTYVDGPASTATGLDFGLAFDGAGNGYGTNGTAFVSKSSGSFLGLDGTPASIADISLGTTANPHPANPFISFGPASNIVLNFADAALTRSALGTSVTITGAASFSDGIAADASTGMFSLVTTSSNNSPLSVNFTFTSDASTTSVPEPISLSLVGASLVGMGAARLRRNN